MHAVALAEAALDDSAPYTEIERPVTERTAAYLERIRSHSTSAAGLEMATTQMTVNGAVYKRHPDGAWVRVRKIRNREYWDTPSFFVIFGTMAGGWTMIFCKIPRTATQVAFRRAIKAITRDYTHEVVPWEDIQVESADEAMYQKRVSGKAPEPAYSIDASGQFTREH